MAKQGNAPQCLLRVNKRGIPYLALVFSSVATAIGVVLNYVIPDRVFELLMALVVSALVINWAMISLAHLKFRQAKDKLAEPRLFPALCYPFGNWFCLAFIAGILVIMLLTPGMAVSVWLIPVWLLVLAISYRFKQRLSNA